MTQSFDDYRSTLDTTQLLMSANCCRHAFEAGAQSRQAEIDDHIKRRMELSKDKQDLLKEINEHKEVAESMEDAYLREKAKVDELRKRIDERDKLINDFISDLDKTENENSSTSIHDYWRGFSSCAGSAKKILVERFNDLKGATNEQ